MHGRRENHPAALFPIQTGKELEKASGNAKDLLPQQPGLAHQLFCRASLGLADRNVHIVGNGQKAGCKTLRKNGADALVLFGCELTVVSSRCGSQWRLSVRAQCELPTFSTKGSIATLVTSECPLFAHQAAA